MTYLSSALPMRLLLAGSALASIAVPAVAQVYAPPPPPYGDPGPAYRDDDIVIYGQRRGVPDDADALSQRVSYADLDLYYPEDRRELRHRISLTARDLCDRLGESDGAGSIAPSCRDEAVRDALRRVGTIEAHWVPAGSYLVR